MVQNGAKKDTILSVTLRSNIDLENWLDKDGKNVYVTWEWSNAIIDALDDLGITNQDLPLHDGTIAQIRFDGSKGDIFLPYSGAQIGAQKIPKHLHVNVTKCKHPHLLNPLTIK